MYSEKKDESSPFPWKQTHLTASKNQLWIVTSQYQTGLIEELAKGQLQADLAKASVFWT